MKKLILAIVLLGTTSINAQDRYAKGMEKAFELWQNQETTEASNMFERIATAEPDKWLPYYYVSQINTIISFGERDEEKLSKQLEKAQEFIDVAKAISPNNPEILVQEALINTAWVAFDGATYGMILSPKIEKLYQTALEIAPNNPRVVFSKAEWDMGSARYFGKDIAPYCQDVERALELFATFKSETPFYPKWGKERAEEVLESCNKS
ncbi:MAG: tetratricopeptide repeat protein [Flagellimonas sp.]